MKRIRSLTAVVALLLTLVGGVALQPIAPSTDADCEGASGCTDCSTCVACRCCLLHSIALVISPNALPLPFEFPHHAQPSAQPVVSAEPAEIFHPPKA